MELAREQRRWRTSEQRQGQQLRRRQQQPQQPRTPHGPAQATDRATAINEPTSGVEDPQYL